jgi:hypothetical protein
MACEQRSEWARSRGDQGVAVFGGGECRKQRSSTSGSSRSAPFSHSMQQLLKNYSIKLTRDRGQSIKLSRAERDAGGGMLVRINESTEQHATARAPEAGPEPKGESLYKARDFDHPQGRDDPRPSIQR